jgi:hypothetical protein
MPHIEYANSQEEQDRLLEQQDGSEILITGMMFFGMGVVLSIFNFSDLRQGTYTMVIYTSALIVIGLILVAIGKYKRSYNI